MLPFVERVAESALRRLEVSQSKASTPLHTVNLAKLYWLKYTTTSHLQSKNEAIHRGSSPQ